MTQYYEPEAQALEDAGYWGAADAIGTRIEYCTNGCYCELAYPGAPAVCDD